MQVRPTPAQDARGTCGPETRQEPPVLGIQSHQQISVPQEITAAETSLATPGRRGDFALSVAPGQTLCSDRCGKPMDRAAGDHGRALCDCRYRPLALSRRGGDALTQSRTTEIFMSTSILRVQVGGVAEQWPNCAFASPEPGSRREGELEPQGGVSWCYKDVPLAVELRLEDRHDVLTSAV
jgi:hypothetical protein